MASPDTKNFFEEVMLPELYAKIFFEGVLCVETGSGNKLQNGLDFLLKKKSEDTIQPEFWDKVISIYNQMAKETEDDSEDEDE